MPGNIIYAECPCGYLVTLWPGASMGFFDEDRTLNVIAYDDTSKALITIDVKLAQQRNLEIVEDPFVIDGFSESLYRCPVCGNKTITFGRGGVWD